MKEQALQALSLLISMSGYHYGVIAAYAAKVQRRHCEWTGLSLHLRRGRKTLDMIRTRAPPEEETKKASFDQTSC